MKHTDKPVRRFEWMAEAWPLRWGAIWEKHWFEVCLTILCLYMWSTGEIQVVLGSAGGTPQVESVLPYQNGVGEPTELSLAPVLQHPARSSAKEWQASDFKSLDFILNPDLAWEKGVPESIVEQKYYICMDYVKNHMDLALTNASKYGVPASITLAQALLESDAGMSRLALESNNHFGIKCRSRCLGCTCRNYSDDSRYDMFRVFGSSAESFEAHGRLLTSSRYKHLRNYGKDYRRWAEGLKKAGYATDPRYAEKLIRIIETLRLYLLDEGRMDLFARKR